MAHLPPAGVKIITSNKRTDLVFGCEVPNIYHYVDRRQVPYDSKKNDPLKINLCDLPPSKVTAKGWEIPTSNVYGDLPCPLISHCPMPDPVCFWADDYTLYDEPSRKLQALKDKYRVTYDVKIRCDAQSRWQNEATKYFAINRQWEDMYGKKYFYKHSNSCPKKRC